ncbi:MAG: hypothetical protein AAF498_01660 [Pseudomonadota bacterium]
MYRDLVKHVGIQTGLTQAKARAALGVVFNAAERQASPFAGRMFNKLPGARTASAKAGSELGTCTGEIARLIEQTPGGRKYVASRMFRDLHGLGLGHDEIGRVLPAVSEYMSDVYGIEDFGHLGDLIGTNLDVYGETARSSSKSHAA